jgi:hypothetical protein
MGGALVVILWLLTGLVGTWVFGMVDFQWTIARWAGRDEKEED